MTDDQIVCTLKIKQPEKEEIRYTASCIVADELQLTFSRDRDWRIIEIVRNDTKGRDFNEGYRRFFKHTFEGITQVGDVVLPSSMIMFEQFRDKAKPRFKKRFEVAENKSSSEIRKICFLSHYGLPEPPGTSFAIHWSVWVGLGCVVLVAIGAVLKRSA